MSIFMGYSFGRCPKCGKNGLFAFKYADATPYVRCRRCFYEVTGDEAMLIKQEAHIWFAGEEVPA